MYNLETGRGEERAVPVSVAASFHICILDVLCSILGWDTCPYWALLSFSSFSLFNNQDCTSIRQHPVPSKSFPVHLPSYRCYIVEGIDSLINHKGNSSSLKMDAVCSSKTLLTIYQTTRRHMPQDRSLKGTKASEHFLHRCFSVTNQLLWDPWLDSGYVGSWMDT
jgi:hypothetical protein